MISRIDPPEPNLGPAETVVAVASVAAFVCLGWVVLHLPEEPALLAGEVARSLDRSELGNPVTAVLLNFRAFDTLLEKAVLILAITGLWMLTTDRAWGQPPANFHTFHPVERPLLILLKALIPIGVLVAFYLLWTGAAEPGGAFQSGTILAGIGLLLVLARVVPPPRLSLGLMRWAVAVGFLVFAAIGLLTAAFGRAFMDYPPGWGYHLVLVIEFFVTLSVAAALFMLANGLPEIGQRNDGR